MFRYKYRLHLTRDQYNTIITELDSRKIELTALLERSAGNSRGRKHLQDKIILINDAILALQDWDYVRIETNDEE